MKGLTNANTMLLTGSVRTESIADKAVVTEKVADKAITRIKVSDDVLFSPVSTFYKSHNFAVEDAGKTIVFKADEGTAASVALWLYQSVCKNVPVGTEVAACRCMDNGVGLNFVGEAYSAVIGMSEFVAGARYAVVDKYGMAVAKKIDDDGTHSYWIVSGNVEVN